MAEQSSEAMNVRFLINTKTQRIVYAEAGKEFVDFLLSFLSMPIGSVLKLLHASESSRKIGSVSNLYESVENIPSQFMGADKSQLLDPSFTTSYFNTYQCDGVSSWPGVYQRDNTTHNISTSSTDTWQLFSGLMIRRPQQNTNIVNQASGSSISQTIGYVKEMLTFIITDDLKIKGSSTITSITLLNQLNIKDLTELEERTAIVDRNKALEILEASLVSTTVLNDVFGAELDVSGKASVEE